MKSYVTTWLFYIGIGAVLALLHVVKAKSVFDSAWTAASVLFIHWLWNSGAKR